MAAKKAVGLKYVQIGNVGVDSGMVMIVDPAYVLKDKYAEKNKIPKASDTFDTDYDMASELCYRGTESFRIVNGKKSKDGKTLIRSVGVFNPLDEMTDEKHRQIAYGTVCSTVAGDGSFPVYAVYESNNLIGMFVELGWHQTKLNESAK